MSSNTSLNPKKPTGSEPTSTQSQLLHRTLAAIHGIPERKQKNVSDKQLFPLNNLVLGTYHHSRGCPWKLSRSPLMRMRTRIMWLRRNPEVEKTLLRHRPQVRLSLRLPLGNENPAHLRLHRNRRARKRNQMAPVCRFLWRFRGTI